jgi:hypothetical protein
VLPGEMSRVEAPDHAGSDHADPLDRHGQT